MKEGKACTISTTRRLGANNAISYWVLKGGLAEDVRGGALIVGERGEHPYALLQEARGRRVYTLDGQRPQRGRSWGQLTVDAVIQKSILAEPGPDCRQVDAPGKRCARWVLGIGRRGVGVS